MLMRFGIFKKHLTVMLLILSSFMLAYLPVWNSLFKVWVSSEDYSHGFFIIPVCIYIVWKKKERLARIEKKPSLFGGIIVVVSLALYLFAHYAEIITLSSFSLVMVLSGTIIYLFGYAVFKELLFPLFFLFFMIPVPGQIYTSLTLPLQLFVSFISTGIASLLQIPVYREGNIIFLTDRTLHVVQACSGLRSMMLLLAASSGLAFLTLRSKILRVVLLVWTIPVSILVNIIRVLLVIFAENYLEYDLTNNVAHTIFGIFIFVLALVLIAGTRGVISAWDR